MNDPSWDHNKILIWLGDLADALEIQPLDSTRFFVNLLIISPCNGLMYDRLKRINSEVFKSLGDDWLACDWTSGAFSAVSLVKAHSKLTFNK